MDLKDILILIFGAMLSYLLGGISVARISTSKKKEGSIVNSGSGNTGTMNMLRTFGLKAGAITLVLDALKGATPSLVGFLIFQSFPWSCQFLYQYCCCC